MAICSYSAQHRTGEPVIRGPGERACRPMTAILSLPDAVSEIVADGDSVALEGFTHLIPFAAGHEIIRQGRRDLELIRMTPDLALRPDDRDGDRPPPRLLLRGQPGGRLAAPLPRRDRERLAAAARGRRAQPCGDGEPLRRRRRRHALRGDARLRRHRPLRADPRGADHLPVHRRAAGRGAGAAPRRRDRPRPGGRPRGQRPAVGHPGCAEGGGARRQPQPGHGRARGRQPRAAAGRDRDPELGDRRGRRGSGRLAPLLQPRPHRPRQRLLPASGTS